MGAGGLAPSGVLLQGVGVWVSVQACRYACGYGVRRRPMGLVVGNERKGRAGVGSGWASQGHCYTVGAR